MMEGGTGTMEGRNATMEGRNGTIESRNATMEGRNGMMEGRNGTMEGRNGMMEGRNGMMEHRNGINNSSGDKGEFKVYVGTLVDSTEHVAMRVREAVMGVQGAQIIFVDEASKLDELQKEYNFPDSSVALLTPSQFIMPGMVDTHIHAPQFPNNGLRMDMPLLQWLEAYTFPLEATFKDPSVARKVYPRVVDRLLRNGTTTASYYSSCHLEASKVLAATAVEKGQRALVGKVNMLTNCPNYYHEECLEESIRETEEFVVYVKSLKSNLVEPIITPRFVVTCPKEQLKALRNLADRYECKTQSHLCETVAEIKLVKELFPEFPTYTHIFYNTGLLTDKSIMAHCVWMEEEELALLADEGAGVSHCPSSNLNLISGHCDVRKLLDRDIKVGLGTDCSGGYSSSILDALRRALHVSRSRAILQEDYKPLTMEEAFRLATLGGARVVNKDNLIGNLEAGKEFDAILVDTEAADSPLDIFETDDMKDKISKFLHNGDDRNMIEVFVAGVRVSAR